MTPNPAPPLPFSDARVYTFGSASHERYGDPSAGPSAVFPADGCELHLHFAARSGDSPLVGVELKPAKGDSLDPVFARYFMPRLDLFLAVARAALDWDFGKVREAGEKLRAVNRPGRGLSPEWLRYIADEYKALVAGGEKFPIKALTAIHQPVHPSAVSRWVSKARDSGYLPRKSKKTTDAS